MHRPILILIWIPLSRRYQVFSRRCPRPSCSCIPTSSRPSAKPPRLGLRLPLLARSVYHKSILVAALAGNWIRVFGESLRLDTWSLGASFTAPLIDGGAGAAGVRGAQARYREAVAGLRDAVRSTARNIEDALAEQQSAEGRVETSRQELKAAVTTLHANEERWRLGAISQFDLQVVRRQYTAAQQDAIDAVRDRALAWVDLVTASNSTSEEPSITLGGSLRHSQQFIAATGAP